MLSGIEMALWDLAGKVAGKPVHALLGGAVHERLPFYASGGTGAWPVSQTVAQAERYVNLGFRGFKIGTGMTSRPGGYNTHVSPPPYGTAYAAGTAARIKDEREKFGALRRTLGPSIEIATDAHAVQLREPWMRADALAIAQALEEFDLLFFEEPLRYDDPDGYAEIRRQTRTPIAGGECLTGLAEFAQWLDKGAFDYIQPDATHVGGIGPTVRVAQAAAARHVGLIVHTGAAVGPGIVANLHAAFVSPNARYVEYAIAPDNIRAELLAEPVTLDRRLPGAADRARPRRVAARGLRGPLPLPTRHLRIRIARTAPPRNGGSSMTGRRLRHPGLGQHGPGLRRCARDAGRGRPARRDRARAAAREALAAEYGVDAEPTAEALLERAGRRRRRDRHAALDAPRARRRRRPRPASTSTSRSRWRSTWTSATRSSTPATAPASSSRWPSRRATWRCRCAPRSTSTRAGSASSCSSGR